MDVLSEPCTQAEVAEAIGVGESAVSQLKAAGLFQPGGSAGEWIREYCHRLREVAAGRAAAGSLDLAHERALLAREQRIGLEIKNATLRGDYASVALLAEVLATASQAVAQRFEHLPGVLRKACPELTEAQRDQIFTVLASARNEWVSATAQLVSKSMSAEAEEGEEPESSFDEPSAN